MDIKPNSKMLECLVCPLTKTSLRYDTNKQELLSDRAQLAYPIRNGVPVMIADQARQMDKTEIKK